MSMALALALVAQSPPVAVTISPPPPAVILPPMYPHSAPPPPVPGARIVRPPQPRLRLQELISAADYPASALLNREQGRVAFRLDVGPEGRVRQCVITQSTGSAALDSATCRLMRSRARFTPAIDSSGMPAFASVHDLYVWQLPQAPGQPREVIVYTGPHIDPRYALPERFRGRLAQENARKVREAVRFQAEARLLLPRFEADPHFGGLVFRNEPEPHAVVMFTGDAEARLRRYTRDPRFRAQTVDFTLADLEGMKDAFSSELARLNLRCFSLDGDEEHNTVTVGAPPEELAKVRAAIAARRVNAPKKLRLVEQACVELR